MINYHQLQEEIGRYLGYGRDITSYDSSSDEYKDVESAIQSGLKQFYSPPPLADGGLHSWSFLKPETTLSFDVDNTSGNYMLPDDFGGFASDMTYEPTVSLDTIKLVGEQEIRKLRQTKPLKGLAKYVAVVPIASDGQSRQGLSANFWPIPDRAAILSYCYYVQPGEIGEDNPFPYGNDAHSETILESCLAVAELRLNDEKGIHHNTFMERLAASIQYDRKTSGINYFGYNGDSSDLLAQSKKDRIGIVTIGGIEYD